MKKNLKFLISSTLVAVTFSIPKVIQGMDDISKPGEQPKPSGIQLRKRVGDTLEAVLGTGDDVLLKLSMDLIALKRPLEQGQLEKGQLDVPIRLFLTDFTSSPTAHPAVELTARIECESTSPACVLPNKPQSFDSYSQFTDWLKKGYFTNQVEVTYDFHIDVEKSAPTLAQQLFAVRPGGYRFIGTYEVNNDTIQPDQCVPQVTYASKRGNANVTIVTLGGTLYLNGRTYPIDNHYQSFPHPVIDQINFKKDETKKFYSHKWIAKSEATAKITYEEFPRHQVHNWPNVPTGTYGLLTQKPDDFEEIKHLVCWDGTSGEEVDISDGRVFLVECETLNNEGSQFLESIVKDNDENLYTMRYLYVGSEKTISECHIKKKDEKSKEVEEYYIDKIQNLNHPLQIIEKFKGLSTDSAAHLWVSVEWSIRRCQNAIDKYSQSYDIVRKYMEHVSSAYKSEDVDTLYAVIKSHSTGRGTNCFDNSWIPVFQHFNNIRWCERDAKNVKEEMLHYYAITGVQHPRWEEFNRK